MPAESDLQGWTNAILGALGLSSSGLGAWVLKTSTRQARLEEKLDALKEATDEKLDRIDKSVGKIVKHITGVDL